MARQITLSRDVRTFVKTGKGSLLARSRFHFARGDVLEVSDPVTMHYDHCDKAAVEVLEPELDQRYFMLVSEMGMSEFLNWEDTVNCHVFLEAEIKAAVRTLAKPPKNMTQRSLQIVRSKLMVMRATLGGLHDEAETGDDDHKKWIRTTVTMLGTDVYLEKTCTSVASVILATHLNQYDR